MEELYFTDQQKSRLPTWFGHFGRVQVVIVKPICAIIILSIENPGKNEHSTVPPLCSFLRKMFEKEDQKIRHPKCDSKSVFATWPF